MKNNKTDKDITDRLIKETDDITKLKAETWENIQNELPSIGRHRVKSRKKNRFIAIAAMAAVIAITWAGLTTTTGLALIQNLKEMFAPEKEVELHIEGEIEDTQVELETNEELRYVIYLDKSRYKLVEGEKSDKIVLIEELDEKYPEVSMEIMRKDKTTTEETIQAIKQELADLNMEITLEEETDKPIDATVISAIGEGYTNEHGKTGTQWDTPVHKYYVTKEEGGQLFVVKEVYFLEAAEGHGARFYSMLETFEVIK